MSLPAEFFARTIKRLRWTGPYLHLFILLGAGLALLSAARLGLVLWQWQRVSAAGVPVQALVQGVRADLILLGYFLIVPALLAPLALRARWWNAATACWTGIALLFIVFMELATPQFIMQYDLRPNRLFIEYLAYPAEVWATLWNGFKPALFLGMGGVLLFALVLVRFLKAAAAGMTAWPARRLLLAWPLIVLLVCLQVRSTFGHRPANPAMFALSGDALVNSLIINSSWSVLDAAYAIRNEARSSEMYGKLARARVLAQVRAAPWLSGYRYDSNELPTLHRQTPARVRARPLNLVIVLEESLGATFVQSLGGAPVTPELEKLKHEGWWFEQLYATGTRSVRGIEAVVAGYAPTPARSVVKLSLAQQNFYTLAAGLRARGYHTEFVYGGEAHFDNMRGFFTGNGFARVVDRQDMRPRFVGSWGASDEDLFDKTLERLDQLHARGQPFFSLVFTSSNHAPFEFPDGRIALHEPTRQTVNNAVKYADYALGKFIAAARRQPYWQDTLFLIVADHDNRVYGDSLVPIHKFHIPGLILGADIRPRRIATLASQIDLAPTLLSLMGVESAHPMIGRDLARDSTAPGRAMMQFDQYFAWMDERAVTILRPGQPALLGSYDRARGALQLSRSAPAPAQVEQALAHVLLPALLYREQRYRLPR